MNSLFFLIVLITLTVSQAFGRTAVSIAPITTTDTCPGSVNGGISAGPLILTISPKYFFKNNSTPSSVPSGFSWDGSFSDISNPANLMLSQSVGSITLLSPISTLTDGSKIQAQCIYQKPFTLTTSGGAQVNTYVKYTLLGPQRAAPCHTSGNSLICP